MNPIGTKVLESERLLLRPYVLDDAQAMFDNWASRPENVTYVTWPPHDTQLKSKIAEVQSLCTIDLS